MYYQNALVGLYNTLASPYEINVDTWLKNCAETVQFLIQSCQESFLVGYIFQLAVQNAHDKQVTKYFYLIDKLIRKHQSYLVHFQRVLPELYSVVVSTLWQNNHYNSVYELKILRKLWLGSVNSYTLDQMMVCVQQQINVDVDAGFKKQTVDTIAKYYRNNLRLSEQQVKKYLPTFKEMLEPKENIIVKKGERTKKEGQEKRNRDYIMEESINHQIRKIRHTENSSGAVSTQKRVIAPIAYNNIYLPQQTIIKQAKQIKAKQQISKPKTIAQMREELLKAWKHECKRCGQRFSQKKYYDNHLYQHFLEKKKAYEIGHSKSTIIIQRKDLCDQESWVGFVSQQVQYFIAKQQFDDFQVQCRFCAQKFSTIIKNEQWGHSNCVKARIDSTQHQMFFLHKTCYDLIKNKA